MHEKDYRPILEPGTIIRRSDGFMTFVVKDYDKSTYSYWLDDGSVTFRIRRERLDQYDIMVEGKSS